VGLDRYFAKIGWANRCFADFRCAGIDQEPAATQAEEASIPRQAANRAFRSHAGWPWALAMVSWLAMTSRTQER
jgi:hypothetical protein